MANEEGGEEMAKDKVSGFTPEGARKHDPAITSGGWVGKKDDAPVERDGWKNVPPDEPKKK